MFGREGHPTSLGAALDEHGRIDKTMHLLALIDQGDGSCGWLMNRSSPSKGPATAWPARSATEAGASFVRHTTRDKRTSLPPSVWSSTASSCGTLATWTPPSPGSALGEHQGRGCHPPFPFKDWHINFLGRYQCNIQDREPGQGLRPLRDPDAFAEDTEY
ncbi:hypothetical protein [Streptomyces chartreusis]|uniref:hypothetical protein n=1 Tax=Streptomyces chartreusis TaxID=1969 RepID=UPI00380C25EA